MSNDDSIRLYFGRKPEGSFSMDDFFIQLMSSENYVIDNAVDRLVEALKTLNLASGIFHTFNPLIPNFMDDEVAKELMWMIDGDGNHIRMKTDEHLLKKLEWMGPGEALCDDYRSFEALPIKDIHDK